MLWPVFMRKILQVDYKVKKIDESIKKQKIFKKQLKLIQNDFKVF